MTSRNIEAIRYVADAIEAGDLVESCGIGFNLATWVSHPLNEKGYYKDYTGHSCGTVACIAGWTVALLKSDGTPRAVPLNQKELLKLIADDGNGILDHAKIALGLTNWEANELFFANTAPCARRDITAKQAVRTLRSLMDTGHIDWQTKKKRAHLRGEYEYV